jgi:pyruvate kinase
MGMQPAPLAESTSTTPLNDQLAEVKAELHSIAKRMDEAEIRFERVLKGVDPSQQGSARNLLHYLALRSVDIRNLQDSLHMLGLSSLASSESHVRWQMNAVLQRIGEETPEVSGELDDYFSALRKRKERAAELFGTKKNGDIPFIMVTFDTQLADDLDTVKNLLYSGMNVARINCAHDDESVWQAMIWNVQKASKTTGIPCKIYMDLAGPKLRTVVQGGSGNKPKLKLKGVHHIILTEEGEAVNGDVPVVYCSERGIVEQLQEGERVLFDDGAVESLVEKVKGRSVRLRILRAPDRKPGIKHAKGINFPDSKLSVASLTEYDIHCLPFIVSHADLVGYSFVRDAADVAELQKRLKELSAKPPHIILKIETLDAVNNLPALLLQGMKDSSFGVMIARGDLAVEIGMERMSEIQDEILWICEAAHAPAIWATQVLETLNKSGLALRSEVTDAARSVMAECVMINKGTYTIEVVESLREILKRSGGHRIKKRYLFRPLNIASRFLSGSLELK